jgi:hypothetical protein
MGVTSKRRQLNANASNDRYFARVSNDLHRRSAAESVQYKISHNIETSGYNTGGVPFLVTTAMSAKTGEKKW